MADAEKVNYANGFCNLDDESPTAQYNTCSSYNGDEGKPSRAEMKKRLGVRKEY